MGVDGDGGESSAAATTDPGRGKKRPPSPSTPPTPSDDGEDSDDSWVVSEEEEEMEYDDEEDQEGVCRPFTVDDFPRFSSEHFVQTHVMYEYPDIHIRGPSPLSLFRVYNDPVSVKEGKHWFTREYRLDNESEVSVNNVGTFDCSNQCCCTPMSLLQLFDLKISGYHRIEPLRNYVFRHGIDNYKAVSVNRKTGIGCLSLTSSARGIGITSRALFEFKLFILAEGPPEDEPKCDTLIEGCTEVYMHDSKSFIKTGRLYGEKCGLDVKYGVLTNAVQATVDTEILRAPICGLDLKLCAKTSGFSDVIRLFRGVAQAGYKMSSVVAVSVISYLDLCIEGSSVDNALSPELSCARWKCRFSACYHGTVDEVVELDDFTTISVKITWKAVGMQRSLNSLHY
uniref:DUF6598 domain-containing protein n=1 Tax=Oryza punctata TaxID=4537 RepID=A0A0E0MNV9_ORYPU